MKRLLRCLPVLLLGLGLLVGTQACSSSGGGWTDEPSGGASVNVHVTVSHRYGYGPGWGGGWYRPLRPPHRPGRPFGPPPRPPSGPTVQPLDR